MLPVFAINNDRNKMSNVLLIHNSGMNKYCNGVQVKGTNTVYFSSSFYIINQKPMIPRTHFHCITPPWVARSSG